MLNAYRLNLQLTMNDMTETMTETIQENMLQCFNQLRKEDSIHVDHFSSGSPINNISIEDNFKYSIFPKINAPIDAPMTIPRKKIDLFISSLPDITSSPSHKDATNSFIPNPTISFPRPKEFKEGGKSKRVLVLKSISDRTT